MQVFATVVEQGHLSRAADKLDMSTSTVSRHLAELEGHLECGCSTAPRGGCP